MALHGFVGKLSICGMISVPLQWIDDLLLIYQRVFHILLLSNIPWNQFDFTEAEEYSNILGLDEIFF